jgi:hypothetical protein
MEEKLMKREELQCNEQENCRIYVQNTRELLLCSNIDNNAIFCFNLKVWGH